MIHNLFPTPVYRANNTELLDLARSTFALAEQGMTTVRSGFASTLQDYTPIKASTPWNPLVTPKCRPIHDFMLAHVETFMQDMGYAPYDITITNMWYNTMTAGSEHTPHTHYGYTYSGTYYVDLPEGSNRVLFHSTHPEFKQNLKNVAHYGEYTTQTNTLLLYPGDLLIFPAWVKHSVPPLEFEGTRACIAFDCVAQPRSSV